MQTIKDAFERTEDSKSNKPEGYFKILENEIDKFQANIVSVNDEITKKIREIMTEKERFEKLLKIDADFVAYVVYMLIINSLKMNGKAS